MKKKMVLCLTLILLTTSAVSQTNNEDITTGPGPVGDQNAPPQDIDSDGLYEDINGDDRLTEKDINVFSDNYESLNVQYFDFNSDDELDILDVQALYNEFQNPGPVGDQNASPQDQDNDGLYEDVNGDGELNDEDVNVFSDNYESLSTQYFDFNGNSELSISDVQALYNEIENPGPVGYRSVPALDPDNDGLYEDVNGDGELDRFDHRLLFLAEQRGNIEGDQIQYLDFANNGESDGVIDHNDLLTLMQEIGDASGDGALVTGSGVDGDMRTPYQNIGGVTFRSVTYIGENRVDVLTETVNSGDSEVESRTVTLDESFFVEGSEYRVTGAPYISGMDSYGFVKLVESGEEESFSPSLSLRTENPTVGEPVEFQFDYTGAESVSKLNYDWTNDGSFESLRGLSPEHTYEETGEVTALVRATTNSGETEEDTVTFNVQNTVQEEPSVEDLELSVNTSTVRPGDGVEIRYAALDEDGNPVETEVTRITSREGRVVDSVTETITEEVETTTVERGDLEGYGSYTFSIATQGLEASDRLEFRRSEGILQDGLNVSVMPDTVNPGEEFQIIIEDLEGNAVRSRKGDMNLSRNGELVSTLDSLDVIEGGTYLHPEDRYESDIFYGDGNYTLDVRVTTQEGSFRDSAYWSFEDSELPDIEVEQVDLDRENTDVRAVVNLLRKERQEVTVEARINSYQSARTDTLERGENEIVFEGVTEELSEENVVTVEVYPENTIEETTDGNNRLTKTFSLSESPGEDSGYTLELNEGWNMVSAQDADSEANPRDRGLYVSQISGQCNVEEFNGEESWRYNEGDWSHPNPVGSMQGTMIRVEEACTAQIQPRFPTTGDPLEEPKNVERGPEGFAMISVPREMALQDMETTCSFQNYEGSPVWHYGEDGWEELSLQDELNPRRGYYVVVENDCALGTGNTEQPPTPTGNFFLGGETQ